LFDITSASQTALVPSNAYMVGTDISYLIRLQVHRKLPCVKVPFLASDGIHTHKSTSVEKRPSRVQV